MKRWLRLLAMMVAIVMVAAVVVACSSKEVQTADDGAEKPAVSNEEGDNAAVEEEKELIIAHLPKSIGGAWYTRMFDGFERYAANHENVTVVQIGASEADAALQAAAIEDFITEAQGKDAAICISFVSPEATEQVLKKAMDAGIVVIGNEGPGTTNVNFDIEAFDNAAFGADVADELAAMMGEEGQYAIMVGKLSSSTHMEWADAVRDKIAEKYPNMVLVQDPYLEGGYDQQAAYEKTMELIKAYPDIKGFFCTSATDAAGMARAIEETGLTETTTFVTLGTPDLYVEYLKSGAVDLLTGWDPSMMGEAMCVLVQKILDGEEIKAGTDLGVFGYDAILLDGKLIRGNTWQRIDKENVDEILARDYQ